MRKIFEKIFYWFPKIWGIFVLAVGTAVIILLGRKNKESKIETMSNNDLNSIINATTKRELDAIKKRDVTSELFDNSKR